MIPLNIIENLKQISIVDYLLSLGIQPCGESGDRLEYLSPLKQENTPSFAVRPHINKFKDFTTDEKGGDIIDLVQRLHNCSFPKAVEILQNFNGSNFPFSFIGKTNTPTPAKKALTITAIEPLKHIGLWKYIHSRGISTAVANAYLKQVQYIRTNNKKVWAIGFANDKQGYELENPYAPKQYRKVTISPKAITTIAVANSQSINLFEGFFDFLSACEFSGRIQPLNTTIVLNSLSNLSKEVMAQIKGFKQANVYFDNDTAGKAGLERIRATGANVFDGSKHYRNHKDFNEFLTKEYTR